MFMRPTPATPLLIAALALAGCSANIKPGAKSIFEAFDNTPNPGEYADMAVDRYDANNRALGTLGLANMPFAGEPLYIQLFTANAADPDPAVRIAALRGLATHGDASSAPILLKALADKDKIVRLEAVRGLQRIHSPAAIDPLVTAMREPDLTITRQTAETEPDIRAEAATALGQYAERRVLNALIAGLDDSSLAVNACALNSLRTLTGQDLGLDRATWFDWLQNTPEPFAGRSVFNYPTFSRARKFYEYLPFVPRPPNERSAPPAGLPMP